MVLVGMMGTGKTVVGRALARRLKRPFYDTDQMIEAKEKRPITAIFEKHGEPYFRELETAVVRELAEKPAAVIATGGGTLLRRENRELLRTRGLLIWLKADLDDLANRVARGGAKRPLLKGAGDKERLRQLQAEREPVYAEADWTVETAGKTVTGVVETILHRIEGGDEMQQEGR